MTRIYSVADALPSDQPLIRTRPFRAPHHTISHAGLVGGGTWPRPGEISMAHRGVLFLDEFYEYGSKNLEALRQPLEDRVITISRAQGSVTFPASFILIAAANPCPCGYYGDTEKPCTCTPAMVSKYQKRISGPILDRIDIHLDVPRVPMQKLASLENGEPPACDPPTRRGGACHPAGAAGSAAQAECVGQRRHGAGGGADSFAR